MPHDRQVSRNLQPRDLTSSESPDPWAFVLPDVTADEVLRELHAFHLHEVCCWDSAHALANSKPSV
jgi:hypothetical protein